LIYTDSTGAGPFEAQGILTGKRPVLFQFDESAGEDIAVIQEFFIDDIGDFENNVGEITFVQLSDALPDLPPGLPLGTGVGPAETTVGREGTIPPRTFKTMTDEAQLLIDRHFAYLPPSFFALAQQQITNRALAGDFIVTTGSKEVPTTEDLSGILGEESLIEFAVQSGTIYTIEAITPKIIRLTTPFLGIDTNNTGLINTPVKNAMGTKGNIGPALIEYPTGARSPTLDVQPPSDDPPLKPATVPVPTYLSDLFTQTIQLALAGVPIVAQPITFV
jgi:hypothetical protein